MTTLPRWLNFNYVGVDQVSFDGPRSALHGHICNGQYGDTVPEPNPCALNVALARHCGMFVVLGRKAGIGEANLSTRQPNTWPGFNFHQQVFPPWFLLFRNNTRTAGTFQSAPFINGNFSAAARIESSCLRSMSVAVPATMWPAMLRKTWALSAGRPFSTSLSRVLTMVTKVLPL